MNARTVTRQDLSSMFPSYALRTLAWIVMFALAYGQAPLFTSNQHQYFLHGMAQAGVGQLAADWLANTLDPTPVFTALVAFTQRWLQPAFFYLYYGGLLAIYLIALRRILAERFDLTSSPLRRVGSYGALTLLHAAALHFLLGRIVGVPYLIEGGFAGQRLLGPVLQPSSFGALLMLSLALFLSGRPHGAAAAAALAAVMHPTYLLSAAALVLGYVWLLLTREDDLRRALTSGGLALLLVAPSLVYTFDLFQPTSPALWNQASEILVSFRVPHHAVPAQWFSAASVFKVGVIALGIYLARRTRLAPLMTLMAALGAALSAAAVISGSNRLALLFPWRISTVLVPIGSGLLLFWALGPLVRKLERWPLPRRRWLLRGLWIAGVLLAAIGTGRTIQLELEQQRAPEQAMYDYVRQQLAPGQTYLIPPKLQAFRLETGAPAFVDFKSIPYRDVEVIEWRERLRLAQFFYRDDPAFIDCDLLDQVLEREAITHLILASEQFGLECPRLQVHYQDAHYAVYSLQH